MQSPQKAQQLSNPANITLLFCSWHNTAQIYHHRVLYKDSYDHLHTQSYSKTCNFATERLINTLKCTNSSPSGELEDTIAPGRGLLLSTHNCQNSTHGASPQNSLPHTEETENLHSNSTVTTLDPSQLHQNCTRMGSPGGDCTQPQKMDADGWMEREEQQVMDPKTREEVVAPALEAFIFASHRIISHRPNIFARNLDDSETLHPGSCGNLSHDCSRARHCGTTVVTLRSDG